MEERIIEIEKKLAFLENIIEEHDDVLFEYQKKIDALQAQLKLMNDKITSDAFVKDIKDEEPPPHY